MATASTVNPLLHKKYKHGGILLSFVLGCAVAAIIFLPFVIMDRGFFLYCGDYNAQQIPFYMYVQNFFKTGGGTWSWATDLGSSIITSYSYYNVGSPFLWLTMLFPNAWMPYLMVPLFILKFGCIAAAACLFLGRYAKSPNMAIICSIAYAFCGFNVYNIFFNSMLEPVIFFPLILWALDGYVYERKRGWFALFVGLALINSYFFFIGNVVFVLIYFVVKLLCGEYKINLKGFGALAFEAVLGLGIGMVLALPSLLSIAGNPRVGNLASGVGLFLYGDIQQYLAIITSMFLPPNPPYQPNIFTEGIIKWTSMSFFLPIVGMGGVFAYFQGKRGGSLKKILLISLVMALVPVLNSSFFAFNAYYYARWYYMPLLLCCLATLRSLEDSTVNLERGTRWALIFTAALAVFGLLPIHKGGEWSIGLAQDPFRFWHSWLTAVIMLVLFYILVRFYRHIPKFSIYLLAAIMAFSAVYSVIHLAQGKLPQRENDAHYKELLYDGLRGLTLPEGDFYRIDTYGVQENAGLWLNLSSIRTFNTTVAPSIMEFYPLVGVPRDVLSAPPTELYALRGLLNVRYTVVPLEGAQDFLAAPGVEGWTLWDQQGLYAIYENKNFVPLGFIYNDYVRMETLNNIPTEERGGMLLQGIGLSPEQAQRFAHLFGGEVSTEAGYKPMDYSTYVAECDSRRATASHQTSYDAGGFSSRIQLDRENLVFFAVPHEAGWSATVNGQPAEVLKVSGGMMAVLAPAGDNTIVFSYQTPGFATGAAISLAALVVLAAYLLLCKRQSRKGARQSRPQIDEK